MSESADLAARLRRGTILLAPGVYDALTAHLAAAAGFEALYLSGAAIAYSRLGRPDVGLVSMNEVADTVALVRDRVACPLIVDADTGFGNVLNVQRTVRTFERAGATVIQLEDQTFPKRCGHLENKAVIPAAEMVGKIKAAVDARASSHTLVIGRTDAAATEGLESAIERANRYAEAGADILFVEAPRSRAELEKVATALGNVAPLMANMVEGGKTPPLAADDLASLGYALVIFPGGIVRALTLAARQYYESLRANGSTAPFTDRMLDFASLNGVLGTPQLLATAQHYELQGGQHAAEAAPQLEARSRGGGQP
jgi:2-methylisocitrate lyase-like PEP mutase family enzyme